MTLHRWTFPSLALLLCAAPLCALPKDPATPIGEDLAGVKLLAGATLSGKTLHFVTFYPGMDLQGADFSHSALNGCVFDGTDLTRATFTGASLNLCLFAGATFHQTLGPDGREVDGNGLTLMLPASPVSAPVNTEPPPAAPASQPAPAAAAAVARPPSPRTLRFDLESSQDGKAEETLPVSVSFTPAQGLAELFQPGLPLGTVRHWPLESKADRLAALGLGLAVHRSGSDTITLLGKDGAATRLRLGAPAEDLTASGDRMGYTLAGRTTFDLMTMVPAYEPGEPVNRGISRKGIEPPAPALRWRAATCSDDHLWLLGDRGQLRMEPLPPSPVGPKTLDLGADGACDALAPAGIYGVLYRKGPILGMVRPDGNLGGDGDNLEFRIHKTSPILGMTVTTTGQFYLSLAGEDVLVHARLMDGVLRVRSIPIDAKHAGVTDLAEGPDGRIWFTETHALGCYDPATRKVSHHPLSKDANPRHLVRGPHGKMYFLQNGGTLLGSISGYEPPAAVGASASTGAAAGTKKPGTKRKRPEAVRK